MLILDEPTNHLDVDAREALVQALNGYSGAVVVVSHDRHMLELIADRLVLVDNGTAREFDGSIDDYTAFVLASDAGASKTSAKSSRKDDRRQAAAAREKSQALRSTAKAAEAKVAKLGELRSAIDRAMFDPAGAEPALAKLTMTELMKRRADVERQLEEAEAEWLEASEALEQLAA
jgi:ATP-binding cassette subfamily F protein 3